MSRYRFVPLPPVALLIPLSIGYPTSPGLADEETILDVTIAGGADYSPDYEGSNDYELSLTPDFDSIPIPYVELSLYDGLASISADGIEAALPLSDNFAVGVGLSYEGGRSQGDNDALVGLGQIDNSFIGSVSAVAALGDVGLGLTFAHSLGGDVEGYTIDLSIGREVEVIEDKLDLDLGAGITWASQDYMDTYFGIDAGQSTASGLDENDVDAGFKNVGIAAGASYYLTDWLTLGLDLDYQRLLGDAADSPIVDEEGSPNQFSAVAYLAVEFGLF